MQGLGASLTDPAADFDLQATLGAFLATGMAPWDAMITLLDAGIPKRDLATLQDVPEVILRPYSDPMEALTAFKSRADSDPEGANAALNAYLAGRTLDGDLLLYYQPWITSLPEGMVLRGGLDLSEACIEHLPRDLRVGGTLDLQSSAIEDLPEGLWVGGQLNLWETPIGELPLNLRVEGTIDLEASDIRSLSAGLWVGEDLCLPRCHSWDGQIPADAHVGGKVQTDTHPTGISLKGWRRKHPHGENDLRQA